MTLTPVSSWASHGGTLSVHDHASTATNCTMRFATYTPPGEGPFPVLLYLSGLTCTWANVMEKSGIMAHAAKHGLMIVAPDTSPRGEGVADDQAYDLGQGAGFYLSATQNPWREHYRMDAYVTEELPQLVSANFAADMTRAGVTGHSMGGHGALTLHLKRPDLFKSCSAFAPISHPSAVPWGQKAFTAYLGEDRHAWADFDATELVAKRASGAHILIDQGGGDQFLEAHLQPEAFLSACNAAGQNVTHRMQPGYDHSYYFVASFMGDHVAHHSAVLKG